MRINLASKKVNETRLEQYDQLHVLRDCRERLVSAPEVLFVLFNAIPAFKQLLDSAAMSHRCVHEGEFIAQRLLRGHENVVLSQSSLSV